MSTLAPARAPGVAPPKPPREFATGEEQDRERLRAAPLRTRPRPSRLGAGIATLRGAGPRLAEAASELGVDFLGDQPWLADQLGEGTRALLHGKLDRVGFKVDAHEVIGADVAASRGAPTGLHTTGIVPVHPASARLRPQKIREWAWQARRLAVDAIQPLPARTRARLRLAGGADALSAAHFPMGTEDAATARERLAFEELFLHQAALATRRHEHDSGRRAPRLGAPGELTRAWLESLPFELTGDQRRATEDLDADLALEHPMQRLLMGEVGSGKTVCALHAMLRAVESGHQAALMAPTETLAEQHFQTLERLLSGAGLPSAALLTGSTSAARRREHP